MIRMGRAGAAGGQRIPLASDAEGERNRANRDLAVKIFSFAVIVAAIRALPLFLEPDRESGSNPL